MRDAIIIDKGNITDFSSFGNALLISPFEKNPLYFLDILIGTIKLIIQRKSPLILHPTLDINADKSSLKDLDF